MTKTVKYVIFINDMTYRITKFQSEKRTQTVRLPASKSILNRALLLAALSRKPVFLKCGSLCDDTRAMISCLQDLGVHITLGDGISVDNSGGFHGAKIDVQSAGTCARFLPSALAFVGGDYTFFASEQMSRRPMKILSVLRSLGAKITPLSPAHTFPFRLQSEGISGGAATIDTDESTQYATGILLSAPVLSHPFSLTLTGSRTGGSYLAMTLKILSDFGGKFNRDGNVVTVFPGLNPPAEYAVEADVSGACYFAALALLCRAKILLQGASLSAAQGDLKFLKLLQERGLILTETENGLLADGSAVADFCGFCADFCDFSDQAPTAAALAPFARTPSRITGLEHTKKQESDRVLSVLTNLHLLGVPADYSDGALTITPAPVRAACLKSFGDHRIAMAFALVGLKAGDIQIDDVSCCSKTFEDYFTILSRMTD